MDTTTLLLVVGGVVAAKTTAVVVLVARRERRQRRRLTTAVATARRAEPTTWALQWAEPGVLLVSNTDAGAAAREVELTATLTASSGATSSVAHAARFVGTGASFEVRFTALEQWLAELAVDVTAGEPGAERAPLASTLTYAIRWWTPDGEARSEDRTAQPVVPVPDLALWAA